MRIIKTAVDFQNQETLLDRRFLGTWCLDYDQNTHSSIKKEEITPYHWDNRIKFKNDFPFLKDIYERKLIDCAHSLNRIHNLDRDIKYWRVIVGPWLRFFIDALFDRYECIRNANNCYKNSNYLLHDYDADISTRDFSEFYDCLTSDVWNEIIFSECIKSLKIPYEFSGISIKSQPKKINNKKISISLIILKFIKAYQYLISRFARKITIISPNIDLFNLVKLDFSLGNLPFIKSFEVKINKRDINFKKRNLLQFSETYSGFEIFLNEQILKNMPKIYIESYKEFKIKALKSFPQKTNVIYTANAYQSDDAFKFWAAEKCNSRSKLIIGQHGGTFGLSFFNQTEEHQLNIADTFISWGWKSEFFKNIISLPSIKLKRNNSIHPSQRNDGNFIHILGCVPRYFYNYFSMPVAGQFLNYIDDQIIFLNELDKNNLKKIKIREDASSLKWGWDVNSILKKNGFSDNIISTEESAITQLNNSALCICTHNGTVPIETLALNFPTIIFWDAKIYDIRPEARKYISILEDAGIFYDCPKLAAKKINLISDDISSWWLQSDVQKARSIFISKYGLSSFDPEKSLKEYLLKELDNEKTC